MPSKSSISMEKAELQRDVSKDLQTCWMRPATVAGESLEEAEARAATHRAAET